MRHMKTLRRTDFQYDGETWAIAAKYGIHSQPGHPSVFTVWGEATSLSTGKIFGQLTDMLRTAFPSLEQIMNLHLHDVQTGAPFYPDENGWFWFVSVKPDGTPREKCVPLPHWADLSGAERAAAYLDCDPALFDGITPAGPDDTEAHRLFIEQVDTLRPAWKSRAAAARITYDLEVAP